MKPLPSSAKKGRGLPASSSDLEPNVYPSSSGRITYREQNVYVSSIRRDHCASPPLHSFHLLVSKIGIFRLSSGMPVSPPLPPLGRIILPRGGFPGLFAALEHKKPRHTLQIVCHSFQDILCMRSLKPSVAISPS